MSPADPVRPAHQARSTGTGRRARPRGAGGRGRTTPARRIACDVLQAVEESDAYANLLLPARLARASVSGAEARLATELCHGTLRLRGYYDRVLARAGGREPAELDVPVRSVLRLGAHQILGMRVADHAAVNESVALAREVGAGRAAGLVNAVLRRVAAHPAPWWRAAVLAGIDDQAERLAIEYSHPRWIVEALRDSLAADGQDSSEALRRLLAADNSAPGVDLAVLAGAETPAGAEPGRYSPLARRLPSGDPRPLLAAGGGLVRVQDEGSQLVALALARARPVRDPGRGPERGGERWLDLCAGPGGKAAVLAAEAAGTGARLWANEAVPARARLVRRALAPWRQQVHVSVGDGREIGRTHPAGFDRVLLDAPCSGLGALRRRPEARWRKDPSDLPGLTRLQHELLAAALDCVRPGGIVAYATCSPHLAETRDLIEETLRARPGVHLLDAGAVLAGFVRRRPPVPAATPLVQLWPHEHGTDAMFLALLTRDA